VGCTQQEHCRVKGGVPHAKTLKDRELSDTDAWEMALSRVLRAFPQMSGQRSETVK